MEALWLRQGTCDLRMAGSSPGQIIVLCFWARHFMSVASLHPSVKMGNCEVLCKYSLCAGMATTYVKSPGGHVDVMHCCAPGGIVWIWVCECDKLPTKSLKLTKKH